MKTYDSRIVVRGYKKSAISEREISRELGVKDYFAQNFDSIRSGLFFLLKQLSKKYNRVVLPAFSCPILVEVILAAGLDYELIDADLDTFHMNMPEVLGSDILILVNTLGNPFPIPEMSGEDQPFVISDCPRSLFATHKGLPCGHGADAMLYNIYKQTGLMDGAVLFTKEKTEEEANYPQREMGFIEKLSAIPRHERLAFAVNAIRKHRPLPEAAENLFDGHPKMMSRSSRMQAKNAIRELKNSVARRQEIAKQYRLMLREEFIAQKICDEGESSFPFFSVRISPILAGKRDDFLVKLRRRGIFADRLWYNAPATEEHSNAKLLAKSVVNFPIKSDYSPEDVAHICQVANEIIKEI